MTKYLFSLLLFFSLSLCAQNLDNIILLNRAEVSKEVIISYISTLNIPKLTAVDLIYLKTNSVPDEIVLILINKNKQVEIQKARLNSRILYVDSYNYFYDNTLRPRALYYSYKRLEPYSSYYFSR